VTADATDPGRVHRTPAQVSALERRGRMLEYGTIAWNAIEVFITISLGIAAGSLALVAFGLDSLVEIFASLVVVWHMAAPSATRAAGRDRRAMRLVAAAFCVLGLYLLVASGRSLAARDVADSSPLGVGYLAVTALVMFTLARLKRTTGRALAQPPLIAEASMTFLDGCLATGILTALVLNATLGWWWADPVAAAAVGLICLNEARGHWGDAGAAP